MTAYSDSTKSCPKGLCSINIKHMISPIIAFIYHLIFAIEAQSPELPRATILIKTNITLNLHILKA